jgi:hypothetical protein
LYPGVLFAVGLCIALRGDLSTTWNRQINPLGSEALPCR